MYWKSKALKACGTNGTSPPADLSLHLVLPNATENPSVCIIVIFQLQ